VHELQGVLQRLHKERILSVLVEGGAQIIQSFLKSALWDEARIIVSDNSMVSGLKAPEIFGVPVKQQRSASDTIYWYNNNS
jgi:diaminohydroxyphosphoribosylaminopyrimidine deaminase/5-amino-6-(5-phosphoribosylamino)uracil reductase